MKSGIAPWVGLVFLWSAFIVYSIRKFWRTQHNDGNNSYALLCRFWAMTFNTGLAFILPTMTPFPAFPYWLEVLFLWVIGFPISIIGGRLLARCISAISAK